MNKRWMVGPALIVLGMATGLLSWTQSPAVITSGGTPLQPASQVLGSQTTLHGWQTAFFTTELPAGYRLRSRYEAADNGRYMLSSASGDNSDQVGIIVGTLGNTTLDELPAVQLRRSTPATYQRIALPYMPAGAYAFNNEDGYERSIFWQSNGRYASVVVSGSATREAALNAALQTIVGNWHSQ